jgi:hypothetical protein
MTDELIHREMSRLRNPKSPDHKYFDISEISEVAPSDAEYEDFIRAYATYTVFRTKTFTSK